MSFNSSSPSNSSLVSALFICSNDPVMFLIYDAFTITRAILILPLSILVLYLSHQQWRRQRSFTTTSHSDIFTFHMAAMDVIWGLGWGLFLCISSNDVLKKASAFLTSITFYGETFFHLLTCVERYLAVVHPITYLGLRKSSRGIRIRNISIGCVWLLSVVWSGVTSQFGFTKLLSPFFWLLLVSLVAVSFFSLSVLRVLIRPGPGDGGGSKERALLTIMTILGVLWLWFSGYLLATALNISTLLSPSVDCVVSTSSLWFSLPSSLVLPLLYLHRSGKLSCCCFNKG